MQQAQDIMERRFILAKAGTSLKEALGAEDADDLRAIVVERDGRIVGLVPPRSGLWREARIRSGHSVDRFVEGRIVVCRDVDLLSLVFARLKRHRVRRRHRLSAATVGRGRSDVVGVITKRAIADTVIDNFEV